MILVENGKETVINQGKVADYESSISGVNFGNPEFSPQGDYLFYEAYGYESSMGYVYDIKNYKQVAQFQGPDTHGFAKGEKYFYECSQPGMSSGDGAIYSTPGFKKEFDVYSGVVDSNIFSIECNYDEENGYVSFDLGYQDYENNSSKSEEAKFNLTTKKLQVLEK